MKTAKSWRACAFFSLVLLFAVQPAADTVGPVPPCAGAPVPAYGTVGAPPNIGVFHGTDLDNQWPLDGCAGLPARRPALLVAVAGRFAGSHDRDGLLARIGAISSRIATRYWSVTDRRWENLVTGAFALTGPRLELRRTDFTVAEMRSGQKLYFAQEDNRSSAPVIYGMRIRSLTPRGFILEGENVTSVRYLFVTVYGPGDLHSAVFLQQNAQGEWEYYSLTAIASEPPLISGSYRSSVNRAVAQFREIAGIPTDREPPAAP